MSNNLGSEPLAWRFILVVAGMAAFMFASLTIFGWIHGWEGRIALAILVALCLVVSLRGLHRPVRHGFWVGFLSGLFAVEAQAAFLPTYFANNPEYAVIEIPFGLPARLATAIFAPINATMAGLLTAGMVWLVAKLLNRRSRGSATQESSRKGSHDVTTT